MNPLVDPKLDASGTLAFENAAVAARVASPPSAYELTWSRFDNASAGTIGAGEVTRSAEPTAPAPPRVLDGAEFISVTVRTVHGDHRHWMAPVTFYFQRSSGAWRPVGLDRAVS